MGAENDRQKELDDWYFQRRRAILRGDCDEGAEEIFLRDIHEKIKIASSKAELDTLNFFLAQEYQFQERWDEAEVLLLKTYDEAPNEPLPLISLAGQKLYFEKKLGAAMPIIDRAIEVAHRTGIFRRLALGTKARIALELKEYGIVEDVLNQLMKLKFRPGDGDCGIERDFFDRLPSGSISEEVACKYDRFSRRKDNGVGTNP